MTNLTPNDLGHLSDEEFNALCPQGHHAPGPAQPLSPAAQAVLDALYLEELNGPQQLMARAHAAAALRAAADQVVPADQSTDRRKDGPLLPGDRVWDDHTAAICRRQLLAIAAELE
jgi:hypothetical protein